MRFGECPARMLEVEMGFGGGKHEPLRPPGWAEGDTFMTLRFPAISPDTLFSVDVCRHCGLLYASDVVLNGNVYP